MNKLIFIVVVLDPTKKLEFLSILLIDIYGEERGRKLEKIVKDATYKLFDDDKNQE